MSTRNLCDIEKVKVEGGTILVILISINPEIRKDLNNITSHEKNLEHVSPRR